MEYPDTYVATVELSKDDGQLLDEPADRFYSVLQEAQDYDGPAVVVALCCDRPSLFRYNPKKDNKFTADSGEMSSLIESFLSREQQTVLFLQKEEVLTAGASDLVAGLAAAGNEPIT